MSQQQESLSPFALSILGAIASWPVKVEKLMPQMEVLFKERGLIEAKVEGRDDVYVITDAGLAALGKRRDETGRLHAV